MRAVVLSWVAPATHSTKSTPYEIPSPPRGVSHNPDLARMSSSEGVLHLGARTHVLRLREKLICKSWCRLRLVSAR